MASTPQPAARRTQIPPPESHWGVRGRFYCPEEHLAIEVDGAIHDSQREADAQRQEIIESLGIRFVRVTADQVERDLPTVLERIRAACNNEDKS